MSLQKFAEVGSSPKKQKVRQILQLFATLEIEIPNFQELSIGDAIRRLKYIRYSLPNLSDCSKIDSILLPLLELEYHNPFEVGPCDANIVRGLLNPPGNCLRSDINEDLLLTKVSDLLEVPYLGKVVVDWNWEGHAIGIIFGAFSRPMISFPVQVENKTPTMVHFLIDTIALKSEIPANVFEALIGSTPERIPSAFYGFIGGVRLELSTCSESGNHVGVPLLGQDFLKEARVEMKVNYVTKIIEMKRVV